jgi:hypothetical protein
LELFLQEVLHGDVEVLFLPPHLSDKTQPLDLDPFGLTKRAIRRIRPNQALTKQLNQLIRLLSAWYVAATSRNIVGSFHRADLVTKLKSENNLFLETID